MNSDANKWDTQMTDLGNNCLDSQQYLTVLNSSVDTSIYCFFGSLLENQPQLSLTPTP